jgi:hypothetical protein
MRPCTDHRPNLAQCFSALIRVKISRVLEARRKVLETVERADRPERLEQAILKMRQRLNL